MRRFLVIASLLVAIALSGIACGGLGRMARRYNIETTPEMTTSFHEGERQYQLQAYHRALPLFTDYLERYPYNRLSDQARLRIGQIHLQRGNPQGAIDPLQRGARGVYDPELTPEILYILMLAYDRMEAWDQAWKVLDRVLWGATRAKARLKLAAYGIKMAKQTNRNSLEQAPLYLEVIDAYVIVRKIPRPAPHWLIRREEALRWIRRWVEASESNLGVLERLAKRFKGKSSGGYVLFKLGKGSYENGKSDQARDILERYVQGHPKHEYVSEARIRLTELGRKLDSRVASIGVVLPLSGRYGGYGKAALRGIECAAGILRPCESDTEIRLIIRDSAGNPEQAAEAYQNILASDYVLGVIGPLARVEVDAVANQAELLKIPTITLSQKAGVGETGHYVFRNFLTVEDQVQTLVAQVCSTDIRKVAILYPDSAVGRSHQEIFAREFEKCDGKIKAAEAYDPREGDFQQAIRSLKFSIAEHALGEELGFQALFIPDSYRNLSQIFPLLSFLNVEDVQLMGTEGWNNLKLIEEFPEQMEGALFVSGFYPESSAGPTRHFTKIYQQAYGDPPSFLEAYGYDSLRLFKRAINKRVSIRHEEVRDALATIQGFPGATGEIQFDRLGEAKRNLFLLQVREGKIEEVH